MSKYCVHCLLYTIIVLIWFLEAKLMYIIAILKHFVEQGCMSACLKDLEYEHFCSSLTVKSL